MMLRHVSALIGVCLVIGSASAAPEGGAAPDFDPRAPEAYSEPFPDLGEDAPSAAASELATEPADAGDTFEGWDAIRDATNSALDRDEPRTPGASAAGAPDDPGRHAFRDQVMNALSALLVVLALIVLAYLGLKRFGRRAPMLAVQQSVRLLGRVPLDTRATLHLVEVGGKVLVLGVTAQHVSLLGTFVPDDFQGEETSSVSGPGDFLAQLRRAGAGTATPAASGADEDAEIESLRRDLERLQRHLREGSAGHE